MQVRGQWFAVQFAVIMPRHVQKQRRQMKHFQRIHQRAVMHRIHFKHRQRSGVTVQVFPQSQLKTATCATVRRGKKHQRSARRCRQHVMEIEIGKVCDFRHGEDYTSTY